MKSKSPGLKIFAIVCAAVAAFLIVVMSGSRSSKKSAQNNLPRAGAANTVAAPSKTDSPAALNPPGSNPTNSPAARLEFQKRPFAVALANDAFEWTSEDGKDTNVIRRLAHNELEYERMVDENPRIFRRQLVYLKQTAAAVFEQAKLTSARITQLTLPGVDGREFQFEIIRSDADGAAGSSRQGQFSGHLVGNTDSLVTLAFQDGREAFTVLSPKENIFLVGEPREDGQVIVKAIDPNTYGQGPEDSDDVVKADSTKK